MKKLIIYLTFIFISLTFFVLLAFFKPITHFGLNSTLKKVEHENVMNLKSKDHFIKFTFHDSGENLVVILYWDSSDADHCFYNDCKDNFKAYRELANKYEEKQIIFGIIDEQDMHGMSREFRILFGSMEYDPGKSSIVYYRYGAEIKHEVQTRVNRPVKSISDIAKEINELLNKQKLDTIQNNDTIQEDV